MTLPMDRFLNAVYAWCVERIEPDKLEEWHFQLDAPLPGEKQDDNPATWEDDGETFMAAMSSLGSG